MTVEETALPRFEMGRVIKRTFDVIWDNFTNFALLSLIPGLASALADRVARRLGGDDTVSFPADDRVVVLVIAILAYFFSWVVLQAFVVHAAMATLNGRRVSISAGVSASLKHTVSLALISLLATIGLIGGLVLLVVPGIIVAVMWFVALPVCIVEHTGITGSLNRSRELTQGYRVQILGLFIVYFIFAAIGSLVVSILIGVVLGFPIGLSGASLKIVSEAANSVLWQMSSDIMDAVVFITIGSSLVAAVYYELRQVKDGIGPESLASVFD